MRNSGTTTWSPGQVKPYRLGPANPLNNGTWGVSRVELGSTVAPGGQVAFGFTITAPSTAGSYSFSWQMLTEGGSWFGATASSTITVSAPAPVYNAQLVSASVPTTMTAGGYYNVSMTFKNTGNVTWTSPGYLLGNQDNSTTFGLNRVSMSVSSVAPGQSTTFNFQAHAPTTAGTYSFQWGMLWELNFRFGQTSSTSVTVSPATPKPTISPSHTAMVAGQGFTMSWSTTNATSLTHVCTAAGTGYTVNESLAVNGSRAMTALAGWVSYPSTCTWTASGAGGTTTYTETLTTAPAAAKPTISPSHTSMVAGQPFTISWSTTNATSLTHVCTAAGTGYTVNESLAVNGNPITLTAQSAWVSYPSSCTWTASGAGGSATYTETLTTVAGTNSSVTYIHTDGLGSPVARTDASGKPISQTRYEPYGYVAAGEPPTIGFTGHVNDADTGLTYMQQRYYDPVAGRFLSIDPVVTDANTGGSFNRYAYANNSPYKYVDPDGRFSSKVCADMVGNCTNYGGSRDSSSSSVAHDLNNPNYNPNIQFQPYAETMGEVLEAGLKYYTMAMTMVLPEIAAAKTVPFAGLTGAEIVAINRGVGGTTALTGSVETVVANAGYYSSKIQKIAVHIRDIAGRHLFNDGNKRTAQIVAEKLAAKNGVHLDSAKVRVVIDSVARGEIRAVEDISVGIGGK
jgi:RHS repeat-associated protein